MEPEGEQSEKRNERTVQRTFLERSPPPECVELVLPAGCTAWRLSAVVVNMAALVSEGFYTARGEVEGTEKKNESNRRIRRERVYTFQQAMLER